MNDFIKSLNLRPQEKRLMVVIMVVVFAVINFVWVRPHFSDLSKVRGQLNESQKNIAEHQDQIKKNTEAKTGYQAQLKEMEKKQGGFLTNSSVIQLQTTIMQQSGGAGVTINSYSPVNYSTVGPAGSNDLFEVQSIGIVMESEEKPLVDFLVNIGGDASMIRVRGMSLQPADNNRFRLKGNLTLNASYRKPAPKEPVAKAAPANTASKAPVVPGMKRPDQK